MNDLLSQGIELMLVGMGTVFVFLTLLVFATRFMSWIALRIAPAEPAQSADDDHVAAIAAAIRLHRDRDKS